MTTQVLSCSYGPSRPRVRACDLVGGGCSVVWRGYAQPRVQKGPGLCVRFAVGLWYSSGLGWAGLGGGDAELPH